MDLENLKTTWKTDSSESAPEISLNKQEEIHLPLEKVRKNMRMEFYSSVIFVMFAFLLIWSISFMPFKFKFYLTMLVGSMVLVISFFFWQFFLFYKEISNLSFKTMDSLKDLMQQFALNKQYYISFYLSFVPFLICEMVIVMEFIPFYKKYDNVHFSLFFLGCVIVTLLLLYLIGKWWFQKFYGKYFKQIENQIEDLSSPK